MKKLMGFTTFFLCAGLWASAVAAGTCEIKYTREACAGKEALSYSKCGGKPSCSKVEEAASAADCKTMAIAACANDRTTVTKSKVINASFNGGALNTDAGSDDFCTAYAKAADEFNKCDG